MRAVAIIAACSALAACSDPDGARQSVEAYGLTEVQTTGYEVLGCSDRDTGHTGFTATNIRGQRVEGVVCGDYGPFGKAGTVRIYRVLPGPSAVPLAR